MKRLVTILALCALPVAAQAQDYGKAEFEINLCTVRTGNERLCMMKHAATENLAVVFAKQGLEYCDWSQRTGPVNGAAQKCAEIRRYAHETWGL